MKRILSAIVTFIFALCLFTATAATVSAAGVNKVANFKAVATPTSVTLTWTQSADATGYQVQQKVNGKWKNIKTIKKAKTTKLKVKKLKVKKTYRFRIRAVNKKKKSGFVTLKVKTGTAKVNGLTAEAASLDSAKLTWEKVEGATGYEVQQQVSGKWKTVKTLKKQTTVTINNIPAAATSTFRVRAFTTVMAKKHYGKYSAAASVTTAMPAMGKVTVNTTTANSATISWTRVVGANGYQIQKLVSGKWTDVNTKVSANVLKYIVNGLPSCENVQLRVRAYQVSGGKTYYTGYSTVTATTKLGAASNLTYSNLTATSVKLSWTAASGAKGYYVKNGTNTIKTVATNSVVLTITPATAYNLTVVPYSGSVVGSATNNVYFTSAPAKSAGLKSTAVTENSVTLSWTAVTGASRYELEYSKNGTAWTKAAVNGTSYTVNGLDSCTEYKFRVRAMNKNGTADQYGAYSDVVAVTTKLTAATGLSYSNLTSTSVELTWVAVPGAKGYNINNNGTKIAESSTNSYVLTLTPATQYNITVVSYTDLYTGNPSNAVAFTSGPAKVTGITVNEVTDESVSLSWSAAAGAVKYEIQQSENGGAWRTVVYTEGTQYVLGGLQSSTAYAFRLRALDSDAKLGDYSDEVSARTRLGSVDNLAVSDLNGATQATLSWSAENGATGYRIYSGETLVAEITETSYTVSLDCATVYNFSVSSYNAEEESAKESISFISAPAGVTGAAVVDAFANQATVTWNETEGADKYEVQYCIGDSEWAGLGFSEGTSFTAKDLEENATYKFRVRAYAVDGENETYGISSEEVSLTTTSFFLEGEGLNWETVPGAAEYEVMFYDVTAVPVGWYLEDTIMTPSYELPDLSSYGARLYKIVAKDGSDEEIYSKTITVSAEGFSVEQTDYSITISWPVDEQATTYTVIRSTQDRYEVRETYDNTVNSVTYNIAPGLIHEFEIRSDNMSIANFAVDMKDLDLTDTSDEAKNAQLLYLVEAINRSKFDYTHHTTVSLDTSLVHSIDYLDFGMKDIGSSTGAVDALFSALFSSYLEGTDYEISDGYIRCNDADAIEAFFSFMNEGESAVNQMHQTEVTENSAEYYFEKTKSYSLSGDEPIYLYDLVQPCRDSGENSFAYLCNPNDASKWDEGFESVTATKTDDGYRIVAVIKQESTPNHHNGLMSEIVTDDMSVDGSSTLSSNVGSSTIIAEIDSECRLKELDIESPYRIDANVQFPIDFSEMDIEGAFAVLLLPLKLLGEITLEMNMDMSGTARYEYDFVRTDEAPVEA